MSLRISASVQPTASLAATLAIGKPVALEASADERETRGFISMTIMRPSSGFTANCTFAPPVSTPISRSTASEALRMIWYSLSVSVCAGATVIESPVCTPIGSRFSMEQMMMQLSALSRTTSISYSFQPSSDSSISSSLVGDARAGAAEREARADHGGKAQVFLHRPGLLHAVGYARARRAQADPGHRVLELQAVFGLVDGLGRGADQLDPVLVEHAVVPQVQRAIERGLTAHGGQDGVGALFGDDLFDRLPGDGLDIGHIGRGRVGHDRGRVAVDQDDPVALFAQGLAGLYAGVVEFAGLADDDRAGANDEDRFEVGALGHHAFSISAVKRSNR